MKVKQNKENYLEKKPKRTDGLFWELDEKGICTLLIENRGLFNFLCQKIMKKPKISQIHLDEVGSFLWPKLDGTKDLVALGEEMKEHFGSSAEPVYERLAKFIQILSSYGFVTFE